MEETSKAKTDNIEKDDEVLELAIYYVQNGLYPPDLSRDKKRAVRKRAATLVGEKGEVFLQKNKRRVKVILSAEDHKRILNACHSEPTSGHYGVTKTWKRIAERFYWKGMVGDVRQLVRKLCRFKVLELPCIQIHY